MKYCTLQMNTDIDYENPWTYNGEVFGSGDIQDYFGFVYWTDFASNDV